MNHCLSGGHVIEGQAPIATDPIDHDVARLPIHGCNRLRCRTCKALVRSAAGVDFRDALGKPDLAALYEVDYLASSPLVEPRFNTRLYVCRCTSWAESLGRRSVGDNESGASDAPSVPWRCDGHPLAELPRVVDGAELSGENLAEVLGRALRAEPPAGAFADDRQGGFWPARLYTRLAGTRWQGAVLEGVLAAVTDADAKVRSRALNCLFVLDVDDGARRAVEVLGGDRAGFAGEADVFTTVRNDKTLEDTLWRVAARSVAAEGPARELARADALAPGRGRSAVYGALSSGDPEWVAAHAEEIARANPAEVKSLADAIRGRFGTRVPAKPVLARLNELFPAKK